MPSGPSLDEIAQLVDSGKVCQHGCLGFCAERDAALTQKMA